MPLPLRNSRIKLTQGQLFWREVGQGAIVVFLHGSWSEGSEWIPVMERLSRAYHCFAPDLLGFGESDRPRSRYSIALEVECLGDYLEALKLRQIYLVGHSLGGWVAASYALKYPEQVRGLVLLSPEGIIAKQLGRRWDLAGWLVGKPPILPWLLGLVHLPAKVLGMGRAIDRLFQLREKFRRSPIACKLLFQRRRAEIKAELLQDQLSDLKPPVLLLQGEDEASQWIGKAFSSNVMMGLEMRSLPHSGGDLPLALPDEVAGYIREFIHREG